MTQGFTTATRLMHGWTATREKQLLVWMARRMPAAVHSDHLTALAALAMAGAALAYWAAGEWRGALHLVNLCLLVNWFGDSLDGTLARVRNQQRPRYGFYVDHVLDCAGIVVLVLGMAASGLVSLTVAMAFLIVYLLVSAETYLATYTLQTFHMSFLGFGPTELRLLLAVGNLVAITRPVVQIFGEPWNLFDVGLALATPGLLLAFTTAAIRHGRRLFLEEPRT